MASFGAGNLGSYMGGGGGDTPTQSTYGGNAQTILLLFVAGAVAMFLMAANISSSNKDSSDSSAIETTTNGTQGLDISLKGLESFNVKDYNGEATMDTENLVESLSKMQAWVSAGDNDLLLKVLENKTYNSVD